MSPAAIIALTILAALATGVGAIFVCYRRALAAARGAAARGSLIAQTASGPIEYADRGEGPTILSIHGAGGGFDQGLANAAAFVDEGFRIIAPSRFGYLRTPVPADASAAAQAEAHAALLAALGVSQAIVLGVSAGARSAIELAIRRPDLVAALVLLVPGTYAPTSPLSIEPSRGSKLAFWLVNVGADFAWWVAEKIAPSMLVRFLGVRPELIATAATAERDRVMSIVRSVQPLSWRVGGINIDSIADLRQLRLEVIKAPTLVISARDDLFNTLPAAEFAATTIPDARLIVHETGGHLLVGRDRETRAAVRDFLGSVGRACG